MSVVIDKMRNLHHDASSDGHPKDEMLFVVGPAIQNELRDQMVYSKGHRADSLSLDGIDIVVSHEIDEYGIKLVDTSSPSMFASSLRGP